MSPTKPLLLSAAVFFCACINLPHVEEPAPPDPPSVTVALAAPGGTTYTNGAVSVQVQLQGDPPEQVELLVDDQPLTTLQAPYTFTWDTTSVTEGMHRLTARARIADETFSSEAREVIVDRTPPQVVSRTPTPGAQHVWVRHTIEATFSEPLKPSTVTSDSVKFEVGGIETASSLSLSSDGRTLTVVPNSVLRAPNALQITMTSGLSDLAGNALSAPSGTWSWSLPISLAVADLNAVTGATDADHAFLEPDSEGRMFVLWREQVASNKFNLYAYRETTNAWQPMGGTVNESPYTGGSGNRPAQLFPHVLQLDSAGNPVVSWIQSDGTTHSILFKRWLNNEWVALSDPLTPDPSLTVPYSLAFQLDANNRPFAAWFQLDASNESFIYVAKWTGQNWEMIGGPFPVATVPPGVNDSPPALIVDRSGAPIVAWANDSSDISSNGITVQRWNGISWESIGGLIATNPQVLPGTREPRLALDSSGSLIIAWVEAYGAVDLHVRRWTGTSWEPLGGALSATPGDTFTYSPDLAVDTLGNIFLAWLEPDESNTPHVHLRRWNGRLWETPGPPIPQGSIRQLSFRLGQSGIPYVAWPQSDSSDSTPATIRIHRFN